jgi:MOSC domain-containing protein YiiM
MAAPHVSGVAALAMSVSDLSDPDVKKCILESVDKLSGLRFRVLAGGRLNAEKALESAMAAEPSVTDVIAAAPSFDRTGNGWFFGYGYR